MKGILLAGGSGSRLYPMTRVTSKQLLPVYDKPMIYYPLSTLMMFDIKDILIISTPEDLPRIEKLLGDGARLGLSLQYKVQEKPNGIAEAFILGEEFINGEPVCLILGDNIFYMSNFTGYREQVLAGAAAERATIFTYRVTDPGRYGIVEFDRDLNVLSIEEKPKQPKSNYASVGLYFYPGDASCKAKTMKPSARGELEIPDLSNIYLSEGRLSVAFMGRGNVWIDAGTPDSLVEAGLWAQMVEKRQGTKVACIEEIAFRRKFITREEFKAIIDELKSDIDYRKYLMSVYDE